MKIPGYKVAEFKVNVTDAYVAAVSALGEHQVYRTWAGKIVDYKGRKIGRISFRDLLKSIDLELSGDRYFKLNCQINWHIGGEDNYTLEMWQHEFG